MKALIVILVGLVLCWHYTNLSAPSVLANTLAPIGVGVFACAAMVWIVARVGGESLGRGGSGDAGGPFSDIGSGDGGGGDGAC